MASFPQELVDMVTDLVRDDPKALASLALTAQSWSPRSRKYLHKTLKLRHIDCIIYPAREVIRAKALLKLPGIMELAQELVLEEYYWKYAGPDWDEDPDDLKSNYANILADITEKCTNVRLLNIDHISWGLLAASLDNRRWFCHAFPHITSLIIKRGVFTSPEEFLTLLNALPPLSRLTINDSLDVYTSPIASHYSRQKNALTFETKLNLSLLQELVITRGSGHERQPLRALVNAFAAQACSVKILDISGCWSASGPYHAGREDFARYVAELLGVASGSLTTLRLHFVAYDSRGITSFLHFNGDLLQLGRCIQLNAIEFHLTMHADSPKHITSSPWDVILILLQHSFPSSLKHMKIVCIPDSQNMDLFRFGELERLLTARNFSLESLTFEDAWAPGDEHRAIYYDWNRFSPSRSFQKWGELRVFSCQEFRDTVIGKMPGLAASGVLRFTSQMRDM